MRWNGVTTFGAQRRLSGVGRLALGVEVVAAYLVTTRRLRAHAPLPLDQPAPVDPGWHPVVPLSVEAAARLGRRAGRVLRLVLGREPTCLVLSLVLLTLLRHRGTSARLVIAVTGSQDFAAHAWVEVDGQPVLPGAADFHRLPEIGV